MKPKLLHILICSFFLIGCISCVQQDSPNVFFDEEAFKTQKEKWSNQNYSNYSFEYYLGTSALPFRFNGTVTVKNGISVVESIATTNERTVIDSTNKYYIKDIDAAFDIIYNHYKDYLERCKTNQSKIWLDVSYDSTNFFPKIASNVEFKLNGKNPKQDLDGTSSGDFRLQICNFTLITENTDN